MGRSAALIALLALGALLFFAPGARAEYADLQGHKVYYQVVGQGDKTLVFIHGWSADHTFWQNQSSELAKRFRVVLLDLPGFGKSDAPRLDYTQAYLADGVLAVMDAAKVGRAVLVTHSMGLSVGRTLALAHQERVAGFFNLDGALLMPPEDPAALAQWQKAAADWYAPMIGPDSRQARLEFLHSMYSSLTPKADQEHMEKVFLATPWWVADNSMKHFQDPATWRVPPLKVPMMCLYAQNPQLPPDLPTYLKTLFPQTEFLLWKGPGHYIMYDRPKEVTTEIDKFAGRLNWADK
jgi:pimeloyl-ACP methyl ester carboxylesterase